MSNQIFLIMESLECDRPSCVTYYDPEGRFKNFDPNNGYQINSNVAAGTPGFSVDQWFTPELYAPEKGATPIEQWDYYMCNGNFGVFSHQALQALKPFFDNRFVSLPARLEGHEYNCLRCCARIDCLDKDGSKITYFEGTDRVMEITSYVFDHSELNGPMIFSIPELRFALFCTEAIPETVTNLGLRGFEFELVEEL